MTTVIIVGLNDIDVSSRNVDRKQLRQVLRVVLDKGATFPSEVAPRTDLSNEQAGAFLRELEEAGVLERLVPKKKRSDKRLLDRRGELWKRGKKGIGEFEKAHWYGLNSELDWAIQVRTEQGEHIIINEYGNKIGEPEFNEETGKYENPMLQQNILDFSVNRLEDHRKKREEGW